MLGLLLSLLALFYAGRSAYLLRAGSRAHGEVVAVVRPSPTSTNAVPQAIVAFVPGTGAAVRFTDSSPSREAAFSVGQRVEVLYHPGRPSAAAINQFRSLWLRPYHFGILGAGLLLIALFLPAGSAQHTQRASAQA